jgi:O-antigen ligase
MLVLSTGILARALRDLNVTSFALTPHLLDVILPQFLKKVLPRLSLFFIFFTGLLLTGSRAGIIFTLLALAMLIYQLVIKSRTNTYVKWSGLLIVLVPLIWMFANWGHVIAKRLEDQGLESRDRLVVYEVSKQIIADHPQLGIGVGGFSSVFPLYRPTELISPSLWTRTHNTYLQFLIELGIPVALLLFFLWGAIYYVLVSGYFSSQRRFIYPAVGLNIWLLASLHSLVDFPLQVTGHAITVAAILGICVAQTVRGRT